MTSGLTIIINGHEYAVACSLSAGQVGLQLTCPGQPSFTAWFGDAVIRRRTQRAGLALTAEQFFNFVVCATYNLCPDTAFVDCEYWPDAVELTLEIKMAWTLGCSAVQLRLRLALGDARPLQLAAAAPVGLDCRLLGPGPWPHVVFAGDSWFVEGPAPADTPTERLSRRVTELEDNFAKTVRDLEQRMLGLERGVAKTITALEDNFARALSNLERQAQETERRLEVQQHNDRVASANNLRELAQQITGLKENTLPAVAPVPRSRVVVVDQQAGDLGAMGRQLLTKIKEYAAPEQSGQDSLQFASVVFVLGMLLIMMVLFHRCVAWQQGR